MALISMSSNHNRPDLGSAKSGGIHWLKERALAVFMIPLMGWFVCFLLHLLRHPLTQVPHAFKNPFNAILMLMFVSIVFTHTYMGIQVILDDYIPHEGQRFSLKLLCRFVMFFLSVVAIVSILKLAIS